MNITNRSVCDLVATPDLSAGCSGEALEFSRRGNKAIRRAAIVRGSGCPGGRSGSAAINEVIFSVAASADMRENLAASAQGSTSDRANAERTLSSIPFFSSPIGANRKASNSDRRRETEAECIVAITGPDRLCPTKSAEERAPLSRLSGARPYSTATRCVRVGNYSDGNHRRENGRFENFSPAEPGQRRRQASLRDRDRARRDAS
jgi:hypothetical protein